VGDETVNPIERLQADLAARFPDLTVEVDRPELDSGSWDLEVSRGGKFLLSGEWRPKGGFGFSTPKPDDLWGPRDEHVADYDRALARIAHLIETGEETIPPGAVGLGELRKLMGLSQSEVAERAGLKQANVSRLERREDAKDSKVGTLGKVVAAMGGTLAIVARFPDGSSRELRV